MTIIEALNCKKPFKRKDWISCFDPSVVVFHGLTPADLTATDWEIEEIAYSFRKSDLKKAWDTSVGVGDFDLFCKGLGVAR